MDTTALFKYFPELTERQKEQYNQLKDLYLDWNSKINVISRKDMEHFYEHHVLHSLAIAKYFELLPGMRVMDLGTGGGFPGIPLAILFPQTEFYLIDGTGKKIKVVDAVKDAIGLDNVVAEHTRAEGFTVDLSRFPVNDRISEERDQLFEYGSAFPLKSFCDPVRVKYLAAFFAKERRDRCFSGARAPGDPKYSHVVLSV